MNGSTKWATYDHYLRSPEWATLRRLTFERDGYRCRFCNGTERLECHHRDYSRLGAEELEDLTTTCYWCHRALTRIGRAPKRPKAGGEAGFALPEYQDGNSVAI
jgi:5-methylcytosine-specific restriction endonuclease McrA